MNIVLLAVAVWVLFGVLPIVGLCRAAAYNPKEPTMPWPPVHQEPNPTPVLDAGLALIVALVVVLVAASAHRIGWMVAGGAAAILALLLIAYYEER